MRILVVDDNKSSADLLARALSRQGDQAEAVYDGATAIHRLQHAPPDLVLTDVRMEHDLAGLDVLRAARACRPPVETIVFTAYGAIETAVQAMQLGARDFLTKPVTLEQVMGRVDAVRARSEPPTPDTAPPFAEASRASRDLLEKLRKVASVPSPVWLEGEIGSGRGHVAWTLHRLGPEPDAPFTVVDPTRPIEWPEAGTVLLPNVDDLPDDLQRELVRQFQRVPEGVRIVATASPDARSRLVEGGDGRARSADASVRQDVYFKLAVIVIRVPPLRERPEDVIPIFEDALQRFAKRYRRPVPSLAPQDVERLRAHAWPGNVRELLNVAERAVVLGAPDGIDLLVTPIAPTSGLPVLQEGFQLMPYLEQVERRILVEALRLADGDRNLVGKILGVERNTLRYKLTKYDLL